jgi:hypothetical protein
VAPAIKQTGSKPILPAQDRFPEDRRENVRVDDQVLLEYWPLTNAGEHADPPPRFHHVPLPVSSEQTEKFHLDPLVAQWMSKIEWTLETILATLERQSPKRPSSPQLMDVNVSGDGLRFLPCGPLAVGDLIRMRVILPPFVPVEMKGEVIRVRPDAHGPDPGHAVVVRFVEIAGADREKIIRYVIQRQAELLRRRQRDRR